MEMALVPVFVSMWELTDEYQDLLAEQRVRGATMWRWAHLLVEQLGPKWGQSWEQLLVARSDLSSG